MKRLGPTVLIIATPFYLSSCVNGDYTGQLFVMALILIVIAAVAKVVKNEKREQRRRHTREIYETQLKELFHPTVILNDTIDSTIEADTTIQDLVKVSKFVAIDFETANHEISSACSLGLAFSDGCKVIGTKHYYISPLPNHFEQVNISIHGITPDKVVGAPTFHKLWKEIEAIGSLDIVAHNSEFDANVLRQAYEAGARDSDDKVDGSLRFFCTRNISRKVFGMTSYKLDDICSVLNIPLTDHHDAQADAVAAAEIVHGIVKLVSVPSEPSNPLHALAIKYYYNSVQLSEIRHMKPFGYTNKFAELNKQKLSKDAFAPTDLDAVLNTDNQLYQKNVVISGKFFSIEREELASRLKDCGAEIKAGVSKKVDYIITGDEPGWKKMERVDELIEEGYDILILDEDDILEILDEIEAQC